MKFFRVLILFLLAPTIVSCGLSTPVKLPPQSSYAISTPFLSIPKSARTRSTLLVSLPIASPGYQSSNMIYVDKPYKLKSFAKNRWVAPPAQMLLPLLAQRIRSRGYFKAVVTAPFSGVTNYRLDTKLLILQQEFLTPSSILRLVMQATIISNKTNRVIASRRFQVMVRAPGNNPYTGVLAANKAANVMSKRIADFLIRSIR